MDKSLMEKLLNESESTSLDFKSAQYPFDHATPEQKGELLKDILAFTNSWKRTDAYILIGVQEVKGSRSKAIGVPQHLDDACLQQFVNRKTNRPVTFSYKAFTFEEKQIGIITIPPQQRPVYLNKDYGKLKRGVVYIRRGSSTDEATPNEIAEIGVAAVSQQSEEPKLRLEANVMRRDKIVLGIRNVGRSIARDPYIEFGLPAGYRIDPYGIDGNGSEMLPRIDSGTTLRIAKYGGHSNFVIHPSATLEFAALTFDSLKEAFNKNRILTIRYIISAEGLQGIEESLMVNL